MGAATVWGPQEASPIRAEGVPLAMILYPRHRIFSGTPPVVMAVPGIADGILLEVSMGRGFRGRVTTRERTLPWPSTWPVPFVGEPVRLVLHYGRGASIAEFMRAPVSNMPLSYREATSGVQMLLDRGLPAEAWLLGCQDPRIEQTLLLQCEQRLGMPPAGWFASF